MDCWGHCGNRPGWCNFCGSGMCCKKGDQKEINGCKSWIGGSSKHECVGKPSIILKHKIEVFNQLDKIIL